MFFIKKEFKNGQFSIVDTPFKSKEDAAFAILHLKEFKIANQSVIKFSIVELNAL